MGLRLHAAYPFGDTLGFEALELNAIPLDYISAKRRALRLEG
jgi:hypothetical protein